MLLKNKNILLGVTGSIAAYKALELVRLYVKAGASVRVIMTESAKRFVTPLSFETLCSNEVLCTSTESWSSDNNHIHIGKWADIFVLAPCTAHTINKLSNGLADNLLTQTALAYPRVKLIAPSANTNMLENPITKASMKMLGLCNFKSITTSRKELACKDVGNGAMAEPHDIFHATAKELLTDDYWSERKVVITGGGTLEKIDDIRYISNFSSGKMAASISKALYYKGADVCLVTTQPTKELPKGIHIIQVQSSSEMELFLQDALRVAKKGKLSSATLMTDGPQKLIQKKPYLFMAAAVADYLPRFPQKGKLKKEDLGAMWSLELTQNSDILSNLDLDGIYAVGFKAETNTNKAQKNATTMLESKGLDAVCLNVLSQDNPIGGENNTIELFTPTNKAQTFSGNKFMISLSILQYLQEAFYE